MWLIDTTTLRLREFVGPDPKPYAILSHTWTQGHEVSMQEFENVETARFKPGFRKIEQTCRLARERGIGYAWVDTCCIDKTNSAELSEAINSMFRWYRQSSICFVYLSDLEAAKAKGGGSNEVAPEKTTTTMQEVTEEDLGRCRWFTRGWTLQELIAPSHDMEFYDAMWNLRGTKQSLVWELAAITRINYHVLTSDNNYLRMSVAARMSWAAKRITTRVEDTAYCLFGIFGINIPLLYGEGARAFRRLQQAIVETHPDPSIFAWSALPPLLSDSDAPTAAVSPAQRYRGIFAVSPDEFVGCAKVFTPQWTPYPLSFYMTNRGLCLRANIHPNRLSPGAEDYGEEGGYIVGLGCRLRCWQGDLGYDSEVCIHLVQTPNNFVRVDCDKVFLEPLRALTCGPPLLHREPAWRVIERPSFFTDANVRIAEFIGVEDSAKLEVALDWRLRVTLENYTPLQVWAFGHSPRALWDRSRDSFLGGQFYSMHARLSLHLLHEEYWRPRIVPPGSAGQPQGRTLLRWPQPSVFVGVDLAPPKAPVTASGMEVAVPKPWASPSEPRGAESIIITPKIDDAPAEAGDPTPEISTWLQSQAVRISTSTKSSTGDGALSGPFHVVIRVEPVKAQSQRLAGADSPTNELVKAKL